jgi:hypothetical protein
MRRNALATLIALGLTMFVAVMPLGSSSAAADSSRSCGPAKGKTLIADQRGQIYTLPAPPGLEYFPPTYGCLFAGGPARRLEPVDHGQLERKPLELNSPWVGYTVVRIFGGRNTSAIIVRNLRTGRFKTRLPGTVAQTGALSLVAGMVLKNNGSVAWIGERGGTRQVEASDSSGFRVLDESSGPGSYLFEHDPALGIDRRSLTLHGSTVTWLDSGMAHSAELH